MFRTLGASFHALSHLTGVAQTPSSHKKTTCWLGTQMASSTQSGWLDAGSWGGFYRLRNHMEISSSHWLKGQKRKPKTLFWEVDFHHGDCLDALWRSHPPGPCSGMPDLDKRGHRSGGLAAVSGQWQRAKARGVMDRMANGNLRQHRRLRFEHLPSPNRCFKPRHRTV